MTWKTGLLLIAPLLAAQPPLQNARLETCAAGQSLNVTFHAILDQETAPAWVAYTVPQVRGGHNGSCSATGTVWLEGAPEFLMLYRIESKRVESVRTLPVDCTIDAGGLPFYWLTGVDPAQSVELLKSLLPVSNGRGELAAIAQHRDGALALADIARHGTSQILRRQAITLLGRSKDPRAMTFFEEVINTK